MVRIGAFRSQMETSDVKRKYVKQIDRAVARLHERRNRASVAQRLQARTRADQPDIADRGLTGNTRRDLTSRCELSGGCPFGRTKTAPTD